MRIRWSQQASDDVGRLHAFAASFSPEAGAGVARMLIAAPNVLLDHPRLGERIHRHDDPEVRRLIVGDYELRYVLEDDIIHIVRIWHCREDR